MKAKHIINEALEVGTNLKIEDKTNEAKIKIYRYLINSLPMIEIKITNRRDGGVLYHMIIPATLYKAVLEQINIDYIEIDLNNALE